MERSEVDAFLSDLDVRIERLRSLYEQYFLGIEKLEPSIPRKDVDRRLWELRKVRLRNTAQRFRMQTLIQRYNTLQQYWARICRQIENGTYVRHLRKVARGEERRVAAASPSQGVQESPQLPSLTDARIDGLHQELVSARRGLGQGGQVPVQSVAKKLRAAEAELRDKFPGKQVDFRVEVRDGKAIIKPFVRR